MNRTDMTDSGGSALTAVFGVVFAIALFSVGPFLLSWGIGEALNIDVPIESFMDWLAYFVVIVIFKGGSSK